MKSQSDWTIHFHSLARDSSGTGENSPTYEGKSAFHGEPEAARDGVALKWGSADYANVRSVSTLA